MNCFPITISMKKPKFITNVIIFLLLHMTVLVHAQSPPPPPSFPGYNTASFSLTMGLLLAFLIVIFVVLTIVSICVNRYSFSSTDQQQVPVLREPRVSVGLDHSLVEMFPVIDYVGVKGIKIGNGPLECAVCLSEFEDDDKIRLLLPGCCHAFHPECIDDWLKNHVTCPVCRSDLTHNAEIIASETNMSGDGEHHLAIAAVDRFTLRLPEHVQRDIEASRGEQRLAARIAGHQYEVLPASRSGKVWSFLRVFSTRRPPGENGEGFVTREGSVRREGSFRREESIRRDRSVRQVAPFFNFRASSLRSGSLRLNPSTEPAEASAGSVGRLSPVTAPRIPCPRDISPENIGIASGSIRLSPGSITNGKSAPSSPLQDEITRSSSIKLSPVSVINGKSSPSSPSQGRNREMDRVAADLMTLNRV